MERLPFSPSARAGIRSLGDNTPPAISVTSPETGLITNATTVSVAGVVSDASPVTLTVNGQAVTVAAGGSFSATISSDVLGVPLSSIEGPRAIVFVARDAAGNESTTSVSVVFDRTPPALTVASPLQGAIIPASSVAVSGTVADATAVTVTVQGTAATVTGQAWSTTLASLVEGSLTITVRAVDAAGNESTVIREAEVDLGPPTVAITSPAAGTLTREATALMAFSVLDRSATSITLNGVPVAPACPGVLACDRTQTVQLVDGDNTFTVEATDAGGRTASAQVTITRDSDAPIVELLAPETASRGRVATASVSAVDNLAMASVEVRQAGAAGSSVLCSGTSACSGPIVIPEEARAGDSLTLTATATDTAGNVTTTSRTVRVTSDGVVTGTVLNDLTSLPLAGATVTLIGPNTRSTTTNEQGRYNIPVADVSAILRIEKAGMTSVDRVVSVTSGSGTVPVDARLTELSAVIRATSVTPSLGEGLGRGPLTLTVPDGDHQVTLLSAQGLPNLLPLGFSPLAAFHWIPDNASAAARATVAMPTGMATLPETILVRYDTAMRDWRVVAFGLTATDGVIAVDLIGPGSYALVIPDAPTPVTVGAALVAALSLDGTPVTIATIPATATSEGRVDPPVLPPTGGTATGLLRIDSPTPLPSGTIVQADLEETYTLSSGEEASAPKRSIDVLVYRTPSLVVAGTPAVIRDTTCAPSTPPAAGGEPVEHLCAAFPITPSRTYSNASLREGRVKLDLLAGRENARGVVGGSEAVTVVAGNVQLNVAAGSLDEDTAISLYAYDDYSPFIPATNGITPLGEVTLDFASSTLNTSAALTFRNVAAAPGDTLVLARVDRAAYDGFPRLQVVALADVISVNGETNAITRVDTGLPGVVLDGIKKEGRYTLLRLAGPIGFIAGSTTASGSPVRALVTTNSLPFVATSNSSGVYAIPAVPGSVTVTARVLGQSLIGSAHTTAVDGTPATVNILLEGAVSQATITPASGAVGVEVNELLTLTSPVALNPVTVNATNVTLRTVPTPPATGSTTVPLRLVLSGSGKQLSIIPTGPITTPPTPALAFSTTYALEITGLLDTVGGLVTAPTTTFRTKDDVKPVYNLKALTFSFPNADGLVTVSAPAGTFPPGTEILIINSGNGVVLGLTAGNDGEVNGTLPAGLSDILMVTVTDPFGNTTSFESSKFINPATGETAIGPGGGVIEGPEGTALDIPNGALSEALALKLEVLTLEQYDTQFPNQRPAFGTRPIGSVLKISAAQPGVLNKPAKLTFNVPGNFATTHPGADPRDAVFYTLKRSVLPSGMVAFEVVDHAFAVCPGDAPGGDLPARDDPENPTCAVSDLQVKTASPPLPEFAGNVLGVQYIILTYDWAGAAALARSALAGAVVGRVRRQAWGSDAQGSQLRYEPVAGAKVFGSDSDGNPLQSANALFTTSQRDGTYTLWDNSYTGGSVTIHAIDGNETRSGVGFEGNPQDTSASWGPFQALRFYRNKAHVDVLFEAQQPPPPAPDVDLLVMRETDRVDTRGLSAVGVPLRIAFRNNRRGEAITVGSLAINGENFTVVNDPSGAFAGITQDAWSPSQSGTYVLQSTALSPLAGSIPISATVRILAAGGGVDTDETQAPRVIEQMTFPKTDARNVQTSIFPTIAFTEPVVGITHATVLFTRTERGPDGRPIPSTTAPEAFKISGVSATGQVIDDVTQSPTLPITAITIQPLHGLKYKHSYVLSLTDGISDIDASPKALAPYVTTFDTFGPEPIPTDGEPESYTTTGFYVAKDEAGEPLSMWSLKHQIAGANWFTLLTGYDLSDPINVVATTTTSMLGRPIDLAGEGTLVAVATAPGVRSLPSNVHLYDVSNPNAPGWVGVASLTNSVGEGSVNRITLRGNRVFAGTFKRGIQIVEVESMRSGLPACCSVEYFRATSDLNLDGKGFNQAAIIATIPVPGPSGQASFFTGIKSIAQSAEPLIVATGNFGLALARESSAGSTVYRGMPTKDGETLQYGLALDVANVGGYDLAVVAGVSGTKQVLMVVDVSNPLLPVVLSVREIVADGRGVVDVLMNGTLVYVSTQKATAPPSLGVEVFDISDPDTIAHLGRIEGVGGRLSIVGKLLYGATSGTFGAPIDGLGGVRAAAIGSLMFVKRITPALVRVNAAGLSTEPLRVTYRTIGDVSDLTSLNVTLSRGDAAVSVSPAVIETGEFDVEFPQGLPLDPLRERIDVRLTGAGVSSASAPVYLMNRELATSENRSDAVVVAQRINTVSPGVIATRSGVEVTLTGENLAAVSHVFLRPVDVRSEVEADPEPIDTEADNFEPPLGTSSTVAVEPTFRSQSSLRFRVPAQLAATAGVLLVSLDGAQTSSLTLAVYDPSTPSIGASSVGGSPVPTVTIAPPIDLSVPGVEIAIAGSGFSDGMVAVIGRNNRIALRLATDILNENELIARLPEFLGRAEDLQIAVLTAEGTVSAGQAAFSRLEPVAALLAPAVPPETAALTRVSGSIEFNAAQGEIQVEGTNLNSGVFFQLSNGSTSLTVPATSVVPASPVPGSGVLRATVRVPPVLTTMRRLCASLTPNVGAQIAATSRCFAATRDIEVPLGGRRRLVPYRSPDGGVHILAEPDPSRTLAAAGVCAPIANRAVVQGPETGHQRFQRLDPSAVTYAISIPSQASTLVPALNVPLADREYNRCEAPAELDSIPYLRGRRIGSPGEAIRITATYTDPRTGARTTSREFVADVVPGNMGALPVGLERPSTLDMDAAFNAAAGELGVPPQLLKAQAQVETRFDPLAYRYEPLTIDFKKISREGATERTTAHYARHLVAGAVVAAPSPASRQCLLLRGPGVSQDVETPTCFSVDATSAHAASLDLGLSNVVRGRNGMPVGANWRSPNIVATRRSTASGVPSVGLVRIEPRYHSNAGSFRRLPTGNQFQLDFRDNTIRLGTALASGEYVELQFDLVSFDTVTAGACAAGFNPGTFNGHADPTGNTLDGRANGTPIPLNFATGDTIAGWFERNGLEQGRTPQARDGIALGWVSGTTSEERTEFAFDASGARTSSVLDRRMDVTAQFLAAGSFGLFHATLLDWDSPAQKTVLDSVLNPATTCLNTLAQDNELASRLAALRHARRAFVGSPMACSTPGRCDQQDWAKYWARAFSSYNPINDKYKLDASEVNLLTLDGVRLFSPR